MKTLLVVLTLAFGTVQTVSMVKCCCGPLCTTPGEVCKDHDHAENPVNTSKTSCSGSEAGAADG